ncbi:aldo/keto reductase [Amycolatopsis jiangsuensis]|uniref:Aryl-alcohol dehydrogenase-like predicted oxidoreductase n=1 Tax=Amycolatopsis jiangsuensis TaxID=1181879 RepID=A0A840IVP8_9PSEU|nr:aldo/keto reductase [Amycolatopsis jiangsuensis]MBB4686626.1 aryl-alcohol dehydrogenase-like predicted oxidoreductase [Amycolatopsis jiangsuensis]
MTETTLPAAAAGTWQLGSLTVNRLGFGAMRLVPLDRQLPGERERAIAVLRRAVELGVNHIDTAAFYFTPRWSSNELINTALAPYGDDLVIATKVGPGRTPSGEFLFARPDELRGQVEENLRQLGREHLDLVNLRMGHDLERATGSIAEHFGALAELRTAGLIRELGISNIGPEQLAEAQAIAPVVAVQNQYGLAARREDDELVRSCGAQGVAFVPFFAVASGQVDERVAEVARRHDATSAQIRLAWSLAQGPHVLAIPGTGDPAHLEQNVAAAALRLSDEDLATLDGR